MADYCSGHVGPFAKSIMFCSFFSALTAMLLFHAKIVWPDHFLCSFQVQRLWPPKHLCCGLGPYWPNNFGITVSKLDINFYECKCFVCWHTCRWLVSRHCIVPFMSVAFLLGCPCLLFHSSNTSLNWVPCLFNTSLSNIDEHTTCHKRQLALSLSTICQTIVNQTIWNFDLTSPQGPQGPQPLWFAVINLPSRPLASCQLHSLARDASASDTSCFTSNIQHTHTYIYYTAHIYIIYTQAQCFMIASWYSKCSIEHSCSIRQHPWISMASGASEWHSPKRLYKSQNESFAGSWVSGLPWQEVWEGCAVHPLTYRTYSL